MWLLLPCTFIFHMLFKCHVLRSQVLLSLQSYWGCRCSAMMMNWLQRPQETSGCTVLVWFTNLRLVFVFMEHCCPFLVVQEWTVCQGGCEAHLDAESPQYSSRVALHPAWGTVWRIRRVKYVHASCYTVHFYCRALLCLGGLLTTWKTPCSGSLSVRQVSHTVSGNFCKRLQTCYSYVLFLACVVLQVKFGVKLLKLVRGDLLDVIHVCETKLKQTNYLRSLISDLVKGT